MSAALVAVGTELLRPGRRDTNGDWLSERLERRGIPVAWRAACEDDAARIAAVVAAGMRTCGVVVVTGGLGPTEDDRTRQALADAVGVPLDRDESMERRIEGLFRSRGRPWRPIQARQAEKPRGSAWIDNPLGSAPGILIESGGALVAALPGVPAEMKAMFEASVAPRLPASRGAFARRTLRIGGRTEASVEEQVRDLYATPGIEFTILASASAGIELLLRAEGATAAEAEAILAAADRALAERLGADLYGRDDDTPASAAGAALAARGLRIATAESCTGGLLGGALTEVPGSSAWYAGGVVAYADEVKTAIVGVPPATLEAHGAVSPETALALARGARVRLGADIGLGITGIAGPSGGSAEKPVGLVHFAASAAGRERASKVVWPGDRDLVRRRSVAYALDFLRRFVTEG